MESLDIPGLSGYRVTPNGSVFSLRSGAPRELKVQWHKGYAHVYVRYGLGRSTQKKTPVHHLVLLAFIGPRPSPTHEGRHLDGDVTRNCLDNLAWGTSRENTADAIRHGTATCLRRGPAHPAWKTGRHASIP